MREEMADIDEIEREVGRYCSSDGQAKEYSEQTKQSKIFEIKGSDERVCMCVGGCL